MLQYEWNARTQITMWFDNTETEASLLRDYGNLLRALSFSYFNCMHGFCFVTWCICFCCAGNKYWSGLLVDYYKPRAALYFKYLLESMVKQERFRLEEWRREWISLTNKWQSSRKVFPVKGSGDALNISRWLYEKYLQNSESKLAYKALVDPSAEAAKF